MCRLLAWAGARPRTAAEALGPDGVDRLVALGRHHCDGWGMAWRPQEGGPPGRLRSVASAGQDPAFRAALASTPTTAGLVHQRWATPGLAVVEANAHPFVVGEMAVAHNGGIYPLERVGEILEPAWEARASGTTDSERYALAVAAEVDAGAEPAAAVAATVRRLFRGWAPTSLNAVAVLPDALVAVCAFDPDAPVLVPEPAAEYYAMAWQAGADGVVVASSGVFPPGDPAWEPLPNPSVLVVAAGEAPRVVEIDAPIGAHRAAGGDLR